MKLTRCLVLLMLSASATRAEDKPFAYEYYPGERFTMGWGPDSELRVARSEEFGEESQGMLSSWVKQDRAVSVYISNLGAQPRTVDVAERIPVSEIEQVKIEPLTEKTTDNQSPDRDGFLNWTTELPAYGQTEVSLAYTVTKHQDVRGI